jgi:hypothetical protein
VRLNRIICACPLTRAAVDIPSRRRVDGVRATAPPDTSGGNAAVESADGFLYYAKHASSSISIWRVPVGSGAEVQVADGLSDSLNFAVGERRLYFIAIGDTPDKVSIDVLDLATGKRSTLVRLDNGFG